MTLAAEIIGAANREFAADDLLRAKMKAAKKLSPEDARSASRAVFAYYRWHGWLKMQQPMSDRITHALELTENFAKRPLTFSNEELTTLAVPAWTNGTMEVLPAWIRAIQGEPRLWLRAKQGQGMALAEALGDTWIADNPLLAEAVEYLGAEDLFRTREFQSGQFEIQDVASQAVGLVAAPKPGETWWDACAGSGGKTLHLSDLMQNKGLIWASDRAEWRLKKLKLRTARAKCFNYRSVVWDGGAKLPTRTKFDGVLVDAPCSGMGTWQRNPHARWTVVPNDVRELAVIQHQLLAHAAPSVKPGGKLIYSACTLAHAETMDVAASFEQQFLNFTPLPLDNPFLPDTKPSARQMFWPQDCGGSGMFVAAWQRKA